MIAARKTILEHWKRTGELPSRSQVTSASPRNFDEAPPSQALLDEAKIYAEAFQMPPERAITYLRAKKNEITWSWKDMDAKAHQKAFTVAKVMTADVLQMIRSNLEAAQKGGVPFEQFKKNLQPMLEESGWWGKKEVENPNTGKTETAQLGSAWRLETIYRTNLATARAQGRYAQQKEASALLPFWEYRQIDRDNKRDEHAKLAGKIFRADDPIWQRIYPPRGFNCGCSTQARSQKWMYRNGRAVDDSSALADWKPDDGWDFNPEEDWKPDTSKYDKDIAAEIEKVAPPNPQQKAKKISSSKAKPAKAKGTMPKAKPVVPEEVIPPLVPFSPWDSQGGFPSIPVEPPKTPAVPTEKPKTKAAKAKMKPPSAQTQGASVGYTVQEEQDFLSSIEAVRQKYTRNPKYSFLSEAEELAMYHYTGSGYRDLNAALRDGNPNEQQKVFQAILNSAIAKTSKYKLKPNETLKRGVTLTSEQIAAYKEGAVVRWDAFTSTSYGDDAAFGGNVVFHIKAKSGVDMTKISKFGKGEREVLLGSPLNVRVLSVKSLGGTTIIEVEEVA